MKKDLEVLRHSILFSGAAPGEIQELLNCLGARRQGYPRGELILRAGEALPAAGLVVEGGVIISKEDFWGNRSILAKAGPGELFGEAYACMPEQPLAVSVEAEQPCAVLFLNMAKLLTPCSSLCPHHTALARNLMAVLAKKNLMLTEKIEHMAQRSTRKKLLSYLSACSQQADAAEFAVPFDRQQMADYLSVDRSAMSAELCRLRDEGVLEFQKNKFRLL